jgi:hypothetical protein
LFKAYEVLGYHFNDYAEQRFRGFDTTKSGKYFPDFWRKFLPPFSGCKGMLRGKLWLVREGIKGKDRVSPVLLAPCKFLL